RLSLRSTLRPETLEWWLNRISVDRAGRRPYLLSGTIALATAVALWVNLGWAPHRIRLLLAGLLLGLALFSAWRWRLTNRGLFLVEALLGSVASSVLLFGAGRSEEHTSELQSRE